MVHESLKIPVNNAKKMKYNLHIKGKYSNISNQQTIGSIPVSCILLQDQVQLLHADQDCCVRHPDSINHQLEAY
jgi:hypothetical protein